MSMPNVVHPWSFTQAALTEMLPAQPAPDLAPVAAALFAAGLVNSARALASSADDPALDELLDQWQRTAALDAAVADRIAAGSGAVVPSVSTRPDGTPRFLLQLPDPESSARAIAAEHGDSGVQAELRLFLDEALRDGDRYVDAAPGDGFAALSAATCGSAVSVVVLCNDAAQCTALEASAELSSATDAIIARVAESLVEISFANAAPQATTMLHAGSASAVTPLLIGARTALERREIGAVAWRCGRADETGRDAEALQVAAAVLGVFGFQHFALAQGAQGVELVPADAMASNEMIFSLEPSFLARFAA